MVSERFAGRLRELRVQAGLTQDELAERAGVKRDAIARWEAGRREPSWGNVLALAAALGVGVETFTIEPSPAEPPGRGRPRKADGAQVEDRPAKRGRKRKGG